jgi:hypothetical protein
VECPAAWGALAPNVVPDYAAGHFSVRAADDASVDALLERVAGCFRAGAEATGARLEWRTEGPRYSALKNNPTLVALFRANLEALGVGETPPEPYPARGSTDVGNVRRVGVPWRDHGRARVPVVPAIHPSLQIAPREVPGPLGRVRGRGGLRGGIARPAYRRRGHGDAGRRPAADSERLAAARREHAAT